MPDSYYYRTAKVGQTIKFPCHTKVPEDVDWVYMYTRKLYGNHIYYGNSGLNKQWLDTRFTVLDRNQSYSLVIYNVTVDDTAFYRCQEDSGFGKKHFYALTVKGELNLSVRSRRFHIITT